MAPNNKLRLLINSSNLHVGGAVAVATSFIDCLSKAPQPEFEISLLLSSSVHANLMSSKVDLRPFKSCRVANYHGARSIWQGLDGHFESQDLVFTVFGPMYSLRMRTRHIFGFAQPLIIYPSNPVERQMGPWARVKQRLKYKLQELYFSRADQLIVELEHVKAGLVKKSLFKGKPIHVVYNAVDAVFREPERQLAVEIPKTPGTIRLGIVSRNYAHKNLACLPALKQRLRSEHGLAVEFFVTFTDPEWRACTDHFRKSINNVGALMLAQSPSFYAAMDGIIFPSLLECFSAVPIEAMTMKKPVFASDLPFIRDCCHEHANYFDPLDLASMARSIADHFLKVDRLSQELSLERAHAFVQRYPSPEDRARSYMTIALNVASGVHGIQAASAP